MQDGQPARCDEHLLWDIWMSYYHYPMLVFADELQLFSFLRNNPSMASQVAQEHSLSSRAAEALLGVLAALGLLDQREGKFHLTDVSQEYLLPEGSFYWGGLFNYHRNHSLLYENIKRSFLEDEAVVYKGQGIWKTHAVSNPMAETFTRLMHSISLAPAFAVAQKGSFEEVTKLLDVGGGSACFCIALALRYPDTDFTVLELPHICRLAETYAKEYSLSKRINTLALDMFQDTWPDGYDGIFFSNIFHDWDKDSCRELCRRSFEALPPGGRIYIHEMLLADTKDDPLATISYSVLMMLATKGKQLSHSETTELLSQCGFTVLSTISTHGYYSLISAQKQ